MGIINEVNWITNTPNRSNHAEMKEREIELSDHWQILHMKSLLHKTDCTQMKQNSEIQFSMIVHAKLIFFFCENLMRQQLLAGDQTRNSYMYRLITIFFIFADLSIHYYETCLWYMAPCRKEISTLSSLGFYLS